MEYFATGVMSGTSLDGLDMAYCRFVKDPKGIWSHKIIRAETLKYSPRWQQKLAEAGEITGRALISLHKEYGTFIGNSVKAFLLRHGISHPGVLASHGHTIFHQPEKGYTFQLGCGASIAAILNCKVVTDFRSLDVALHGQGAPLVPIGDAMLFGKFGACLNLGGFANISFTTDNKRTAFDICPLNFVINRIIIREKIPYKAKNQTVGINKIAFITFDAGGEIAKSGRPVAELTSDMNNLDYYTTSRRESLGAEWVEHYLWPLIEKSHIPYQDILRSFYEHAAMQVANAARLSKAETILVTGGGAYNDFFMQLLKEKSGEQIHYIIPDTTLVEFKEALIFALLGILRVNEQINCLSSVTGSIKNNSGGCIYVG